MLKLLAVVAVLSAASVAGKPNKGADANASHADPKSPSATIVQQYEYHASDNPNKASADPPKWYTPFKDPNVLLVVVGFVTCGVIIYQSIQTARAVEAANRGLETVKTKERAKLLLKLEPINPKAGQFPEVKFTITNAGESNAIVEFAYAGLHLSESDILDEASGGLEIKVSSSVLAPGKTSEEVAWLPSLDRYPGNIAEQDPVRLHLRGLIVFADAFEDRWRVKFHYIWRAYGMQVWVPHMQAHIVGEWEPQHGGESRIPKPPKTQWGKILEWFRRGMEETRPN